MTGDRVNNGRFALAFLTSMSPLALAGALAPAALTAPALADVQSVAPYYAVVTDKAEAHCGPSDRFYRIGELTTGQVVLVDGEGEAWSRISYPSTLWAFARVEDVKVQGGTATLSSASKLKAANAAGGYGGSWKALMDSPLPAGMTLKVVEPTKEGDVIVGYKIAAPEVPLLRRVARPAPCQRCGGGIVQEQELAPVNAFDANHARDQDEHARNQPSNPNDGRQRVPEHHPRLQQDKHARNARRGRARGETRPRARPSRGARCRQPRSP